MQCCSALWQVVCQDYTILMCVSWDCEECSVLFWLKATKGRCSPACSNHGLVLVLCQMCAPTRARMCLMSEGCELLKCKILAPGMLLAPRKCLCARPLVKHTPPLYWCILPLGFNRVL